jgi:hypothetical protein
MAGFRSVDAMLAACKLFVRAAPFPAATPLQGRALANNCRKFYSN